MPYSSSYLVIHTKFIARRLPHHAGISRRDVCAGKRPDGVGYFGRWAAILFKKHQETQLSMGVSDFGIYVCFQRTSMDVSIAHPSRQSLDTPNSSNRKTDLRIIISDYLIIPALACGPISDIFILCQNRILKSKSFSHMAPRVACSLVGKTRPI